MATVSTKDMKFIKAQSRMIRKGDGVAKRVRVCIYEDAGGKLVEVEKKQGR